MSSVHTHTPDDSSDRTVPWGKLHAEKLIALCHPFTLTLLSTVLTEPSLGASCTQKNWQHYVIRSHSHSCRQFWLDQSLRPGAHRKSRELCYLFTFALLSTILTESVSKTWRTQKKSIELCHLFTVALLLTILIESVFETRCTQKNWQNYVICSQLHSCWQFWLNQLLRQATYYYWSLLYSAHLGSRADSLRSHVILHEWTAFYSAFLNIHRSGVLTALAWLVPPETAAVSARSVYTIQLCTLSPHAKPHT